MSEPLSRVVLLAQLRFSASLCTAARSTGNLSQGVLIRLTEPRPKAWFGAVPTTTRLTTAMELLNGSLTNSCRAGPVAGVYGFMSTPSRGSTPKSGSSQFQLWSGSTVPAGAPPSSPLSVCSWTMAPSAVTTENTALQLPSGDGPRKAVPTAPAPSEPGTTWGCAGTATTLRFVRLPT